MSVFSSVYVSVSLGTLPGRSPLAGLPQSEGGEGSSREEGETSAAWLDMQASSLSNMGYQHKKTNGSSEASSMLELNEGGCTLGRACKFPHVCENFQRSHPKFRCPSTTGPRKRPKLN